MKKLIRNSLTRFMLCHNPMLGYYHTKEELLEGFLRMIKSTLTTGVRVAALTGALTMCPVLGPVIYLSYVSLTTIP